jgi:ribosomal protein S27E
MALTRRIKKLSKSMVTKISGRLILICHECNNEEVEVPADTAKVTCARCVQKMIAPPAYTTTEKSDKPRGWQLKRYFEHNGVVYSRGQVVTDAILIEELKAGPPPKIPSNRGRKPRAKKKTRKTRGKKNDRTAE